MWAKEAARLRYIQQYDIHALFPANTNRYIYIQQGTTSYVWSVAYSPDERRIISPSTDKTIQTWGAKTDAAVGKPLEGHTHC